MRSHLGFLLAAAIAIGAAGAGCASSGMDTAASTAERMDELGASLEEVSANIDATSGALETLVAQPNGDLKKLFGDYRDTLEKLEKSAAKAGDDARKSIDQKDEFLENWEKKLEEIESQQIRDISAARRDEAKAAFAATHSALEEVQVTFEPLMQQLRDVRASLTHDLNPAGVNAIAPIAKQVAENVKRSKDALAKVSAELSQLSEQITPTKQPK